MKDKINRFLDLFEERFNFIIDITALIGSIFTIILAILIFVLGIINKVYFLDNIEFIILPGFIGFMAIIMLFALRITRHLTKEKEE
ncbi:MAG: hypothetical protein KAJ22_00220 [Candidatus Izimaplasma sp.]|nr:hypothetical protein [Candidatus Izimaplasma bacterium]